MLSFTSSLRTVAPRARVRSGLLSRLPRPGQVSVSASGFHSSCARASLKESDINRNGLEDEYALEKEESLRNVREGKAHWRQQLASESEADVKADRGEIDFEPQQQQQQQSKTNPVKSSSDSEMKTDTTKP